MIPVTTAPGETIFLNPGDMLKTSKIANSSTRMHINSLRLELSDNYNRPLDLNGLNFSVGIQFEYVPFATEAEVEEDQTQLLRSVLRRDRIMNAQPKPKKVRPVVIKKVRRRDNKNKKKRGNSINTNDKSNRKKEAREPNKNRQEASRRERPQEPRRQEEEGVS